MISVKSNRFDKRLVARRKRQIKLICDADWRAQHSDSLPKLTVKQCLDYYKLALSLYGVVL